jgi:hypothetical protein
MRRTVTLKKLEANRRNALRSTGPGTPQGKAISRWNALKHGLLAREVVLDCGDGKENRLEFDQLLDQLRQEFQPLGRLEEILVETIAVSYWRKARVIRCEAGDLRRELDQARAQLRSDQQCRVNVQKNFVGMSDSAGHALRESSAGIDCLCSVLDEVEDQVETAGYVSEENVKRLVHHFGKDNLTRTHVHHREPAASMS